MPDIENTLNQRGEQYGSFRANAKLMQKLKQALRRCTGWSRLADDQCEALEMICHKMSRIVNGDPDYADSWVDIAGYAMLVAERLSGEECEPAKAEPHGAAPGKCYLCGGYTTSLVNNVCDTCRAFCGRLD